MKIFLLSDSSIYENGLYLKWFKAFGLNDATDDNSYSIDILSDESTIYTEVINALDADNLFNLPTVESSINTAIMNNKYDNLHFIINISNEYISRIIMILLEFYKEKHNINLKAIDKKFFPIDYYGVNSAWKA